MSRNFINAEEVLHAINREYIILDDPEIRANRKLIKSTLKDLIDIMKTLDPTFKSIYQELYGESFYDCLNVGKPHQFDRDLLFCNLERKFTCKTHMRKNCGCVKLEQSNKPGYFWLKINPNFQTSLNKFLEDGYLKTDKVLIWFKGLVSRALNEIKNTSLEFVSQSGPAITLLFHGSFGPFKVKLVPAFTFGPGDWPSGSYKANPSTSIENFSIVPDQVKDQPNGERYWRASFEAQEEELIFHKHRLKPALRLLKKMRNSLNHRVSSYALRTIFLWELDNESANWHSSLTDAFLNLLEKYQESLEKGEIQCYWNKSFNLLESVHPGTLRNHSNEIKRKLRAFKENAKRNPLYIAKIILKEGSEEYRRLVEDKAMKRKKMIPGGRPRIETTITDIFF